MICPHPLKLHKNAAKRNVQWSVLVKRKLYFLGVYVKKYWKGYWLPGGNKISFWGCLHFWECILSWLKTNTHTAELQKDFFCPVSWFSNKKCPNYVFSKFCHSIMQEIEQMLVSFSILFNWSWTVSWINSVDSKWIKLIRKEAFFNFMHHIIIRFIEN